MGVGGLGGWGLGGWGLGVGGLGGWGVGVGGWGLGVGGWGLGVGGWGYSIVDPSQLSVTTMLKLIAPLMPLKRYKAKLHLWGPSIASIQPVT